VPIIYLDNNGTTAVLPEVLTEMLPHFSGDVGNASSLHAGGRRSLSALKTARERVARLLGCQPAEILFTSGGTEGDNLALAGIVNPGDHVITSVIEHSAVQQTCAWLERQGCEVTRVGVDRQGRVNPDDVRRALRPGTRLISIMMANNETGVLQPVDEIGTIAAEADVWFHTDAVQAAGKVPLSVEKIRCDLLTLTAHKMHGPQGTGALFVRRGTPLRPLFHGGHQEKGRRPGTENVAGIAGLGKACEIALRGFNDGSVDRMEALREKLETGLLTSVQEAGVNGRAAARVPNTANIFFDGVSGDALVVALDHLGIAASRGAACNAGESEPSGVLMAMGLSGERSRSSVRFSLGKLNTEAEIDRMIEVLPETVHRLRAAHSFVEAELALNNQRGSRA
jgi:cysteine desulfurase